MTQFSIEEVRAEVDALAEAYFALKRIPPVGRERSLRYLTDRLTSEDDKGLKAAMAIARFARKAERVLAKAKA